MTKPRAGTPESHAFVLGRIRAHLAAGGVATRRAFMAAERERAERTGEDHVTPRDADGFPGRWGGALSAARAVDISGLELDDEATDPNYVPPPLEAVPDGFAADRVNTLVDADGEPARQWIRAPRSRAKGELADQVPEGHSIRAVSTLVSGDGRTVQQWIKTSAEAESREELLERLLLELPQRIPARAGAIDGPPATDGDLLAVYPMGDPHIGMLSWAPETGEDFDLPRAQRIMRTAIDELVLRGPATCAALIVNLGDFFHSDDNENRTRRAGHALDVDGRWAKVLRVGIDIMRHTIDRALEAHQRVRVINATGNHDDSSSIFLSVALDAYYTNEPRVEIETSPAPFHYHRFGRCLIGVTHGHMAKGTVLESVMASDRPRDWGETDHRFWLCGHIHHTRRVETRGCTIEAFRTLAPADAWHHAKGYRSGRDMNRITLHRRFGETARHTVTASFLQAQFEALLSSPANRMRASQ